MLTTHYMEEASRLCDRVGVMDHGRVIALGTPAELIASLGADQIVEFSVRGEIERARAGRVCRACAACAPTDGGYALTVTDIGAALPALLAELGGSAPRCCR